MGVDFVVIGEGFEGGQGLLVADLAEEIDEGGLEIVIIGFELLDEREDHGAAGFDDDAEDVGLEVFLLAVLEVFNIDGGGELAGGDECVDARGVAVAARGPLARRSMSLRIQLRDRGLRRSGSLLRGGPRSCFGNVAEVIAQPWLRSHDLDGVAAVGGGFEGGDEVFGLGLGVEEGLGVGLGQFGVVDERVVHRSRRRGI